MPSPAHLMAWTVASAILILIPGPSLLFTLGRALSAGPRTALLTVVGNALGIFTQLVGVAVGLGPVVAASATAYTVLKVLGAGYLIWLGVQAIRHRQDAAEALSRGLPTVPPASHAVRAGYVVGVTNPKTVVFFAALLPQFVDPGRGAAWLQMVVLGGIFAALAMLSDGTIALVAGKVRDWFAQSPRRMARMGGIGGAMMMVLGIGVLFTGRPD